MTDPQGMPSPIVRDVANNDMINKISNFVESIWMENERKDEDWHSSIPRSTASVPGFEQARESAVQQVVDVENFKAVVETQKVG